MDITYAAENTTMVSLDDLVRVECNTLICPHNTFTGYCEYELSHDIASRIISHRRPCTKLYMKAKKYLYTEKKLQELEKKTIVEVLA